MAPPLFIQSLANCVRSSSMCRGTCPRWSSAGRRRGRRTRRRRTMKIRTVDVTAT